MLSNVICFAVGIVCGAVGVFEILLCMAQKDGEENE